MIATAEQPVYIQKMDETDISGRTMATGSELMVHYFHYTMTFPVTAVDLSKVEMSDSELLIAASRSGTFDFLNDPAEDRYNGRVPSHDE